MFQDAMSALGGAAAGFTAVSASGMTAAGMVGGGAGFGACCWPCRCRCSGLAMYGVVRAVGG